MSGDEASVFCAFEYFLRAGLHPARTCFISIIGLLPQFKPSASLTLLITITGSHSIVKNDMLSINSGVQKWNGTNVFPPLHGVNSTVPLKANWNWKPNVAVSAESKNVSSLTTGTLPPSQMRGCMFHGSSDRAEEYAYGGTTYMGNQSLTPIWLHVPPLITCGHTDLVETVLGRRAQVRHCKD
ncbi:hypothetical protein DE146DRAFT_40607 [Phaeosphaeria sp. MPI-PUGE-AT-0046c]|nr:hypothetical protein DE146DRAFT_40607 [Phaeosphaeria sp. MPI-PUGE-AT-0046c]